MTSINLQKMGQEAKAASIQLSQASAQEKNEALKAMAQGLRDQVQEILQANQADIELAKENNLTAALIERLTLNEGRVEAMAKGLDDVARLDDPIGYVEEQWINENGLKIAKTRVPLGVIGIIYESRPNVTSDAAGLCFKSGNVVILRGGKETIQSNIAILKALHTGLEKIGMPKAAIQLITDPSRELATEFMQLDEYIDCLIPRGSAGLINSVKRQATVPVIETGVGVDHVYVDASADLEMASEIVFNSKTDRPSVCNAMETLIVHRDFAEEHLEALLNRLHRAEVEIHGDQAAQASLDYVKVADDEFYATEHLSLTMGVRIVDNFEEAIEHIQKYSSGHTDAIVTSNYFSAKRFTEEVDSAVVMVNASTRFTDGGVFGFGGEIGISTQKLHARGPMGIKELTSYKYVVYGEGQIR